MILRMFAVYDTKAVAYMQPFFYASVGQALRGFGDACLDDKSPLSKHPSDYQLFEIGQFDDNAGSVEGVSQPKYLGSALDFVASRPVQAKPVMMESVVGESNGS